MVKIIFNATSKFNLGAVQSKFIIRPVCFGQYVFKLLSKKAKTNSTICSMNGQCTIAAQPSLKRGDNKFMEMALNILLLLNMQQCSIASVSVQTHKTIACNNWVHCQQMVMAGRGGGRMGGKRWVVGWTGKPSAWEMATANLRSLTMHINYKYTDTPQIRNTHANSEMVRVQWWQMGRGNGGWLKRGRAKFNFYLLKKPFTQHEMIKIFKNINWLVNKWQFYNER